jgi:hypothetical protein
MTLAFEYVAAVLMLMGIGWLLDRWLGSGPWIMLGFAVAGFVLGFLRIFYAEEYAKARRETLGIPHPTQREVPEVLKDTADEERKWAPGTLFPGKAGDGIVTYADWRPRRFGEPVPPEIAPSSGDSR